MQSVTRKSNFARTPLVRWVDALSSHARTRVQTLSTLDAHPVVNATRDARRGEKSSRPFVAENKKTSSSYHPTSNIQGFAFSMHGHGLLCDEEPMNPTSSVEDVRGSASPTIDESESKSSCRKILVEATFQDTFPQGCQFSPDGLCLLTAQSNELLLYNTEFGREDDSNPPPPWNPALKCPAGDSVRSYLWYPHMDSRDPSTCCFVGTARYVF
jgi:hypothetical protein